jgi:hypothetical protein
MTIATEVPPSSDSIRNSRSVMLIDSFLLICCRTETR